MVSGMLEVGNEAQMLHEAIRRCAMFGAETIVVNSERIPVWEIEPDTKVDDDDLAYPVIVHMREGTIASDGIALLYTRSDGS